MVVFPNTPRKLVLLFLILPALFLFTACPELPPPDCGTHQVEVNGSCECEDGYHWNEDGTECLLDSTSHNFVFEIDTLGNYGELNDVFAISPDNVWVVGEIKTDSGTYNAAQWNGSEWEIFNIEAYYGANMISPQLSSLFYFNDNDIWALGSYPYHWNGEKWTFYHLTDMGIIPGGLSGEIWGSSPNSVFFVGRNGRIVHYNGSGFTRMESGTDIRLRSVTGSVDPETGEIRVWAGGWEDTRRGLVIYYDGIEWNKVWDAENPFYQDPNYLDPGSIWAPDHESLVLYVGGRRDGIVVHHGQDIFNDYQILHHENQGAIHDINGNSINDYFLVGDFDNVLHYNGASFRRYPELSGGIKYSAVAQSEDYVFICKAYAPIVVRGKRIP